MKKSYSLNCSVFDKENIINNSVINSINFETEYIKKCFYTCKECEINGNNINA